MSELRWSGEAQEGIKGVGAGGRTLRSSGHANEKVLHEMPGSRLVGVALLLVVASAAGCASTTKDLPLASSGVELTSCGESGNEAQASGTLFNDYPTTGDYTITVDFYRQGVKIGSASPGGPLMNTNSEGPFAHDTWSATLEPVAPGPVTCRIASVTRTDDGGPSGRFTRPTADVTLSNCNGGGTASSVTVNVYNKHLSTGNYTVDVGFMQNGRTFAYATSDSLLDGIEGYDRTSESVVSLEQPPDPSAPVTCFVAGVYRWSG